MHRLGLIALHPPARTRHPRQYPFPLSEYLEGCLDRQILPQANNALRALFREARDRGLIPRPREQISFARRRVWKPGTSYFIAALSDAAQAAEARTCPFHF